MPAAADAVVAPSPTPRRRPVVIVVRDGWGKNPDPRWDNANAVALAEHPVADRLLAEYLGALIPQQRVRRRAARVADSLEGVAAAGYNGAGRDSAR